MMSRNPSRKPKKQAPHNAVETPQLKILLVIIPALALVIAAMFGSSAINDIIKRVTMPPPNAITPNSTCSVQPITPVVSGDYESLGDLYRDGTEYDCAIEAYTKAISLEKISLSQGRYYSKAGTMYLLKRDYNQAIESFNKSLQLGFEGALVGRGMAFDKVGNFEAAAQDLTKAIEKYPSDPTSTDYICKNNSSVKVRELAEGYFRSVGKNICS